MTSNPETAGVEPVALAEALLADFEVNLSCWPREKALRVAANRVLGPALSRPAGREDGEAQAIIDELNACYLYGVSEKSDKLAQRIIAHLSRPAPEQAPDQVDCERCCGNGELVSDWETYLHPPEGAPGDAGAMDCPGCDGRGTIDAPDHANCAVGEEYIQSAANKVMGIFRNASLRPDENWKGHVAAAIRAAMPTSEAIRADERARVGEEPSRRDQAMAIIAAEAEEMGYIPEDVREYRRVSWYDGDDLLLLQSVERAISTGLAVKAKERAEIVAWLRSGKRMKSFGRMPTHSDLANAIQRGDHLTGGGE